MSASRSPTAGLLHELSFDGSWAGWRVAARGALGRALEPARVAWRAGDEAQPSLLGVPDRIVDGGDAVDDAVRSVPRAFLTLGADVACARRPSPWDVLYRVLWRLTHGERALLDVYVDEDVHLLHRLAKAVRREGHKLRAFVRFRLVDAGSPRERYVAWFEPEHDVLAREAPFFVRRFPSMRWSILTPDRSVHWDGDALRWAGGVGRASAPSGDALEELWRTYYASTFNPARPKPAMMRSEMPVRYWKGLPEASLIAPLLRDAPGRVRRMLEQERQSGVTPRVKASAGGLPPSAQDTAERAPVRQRPAASRTESSPSPAAPATPVSPHDPGVAGAADRSERARALLGMRGVPAGANPLTNGELRVGTASWTDPTMLAPGVFYPPDARDAASRLAYYAERFSLVEVDATYYALPSPRTAALWVERTPATFRFDVKAHALMTGHATEVARLPRDLRDALPTRLAGAERIGAGEMPPELVDEVWRRFVDALAPLAAAGRLGTLLLQLPRWRTATDDAERWIAGLRERAGALPCAVEFRHASWADGASRTARTLDLLRAHDLAYVMVDAPPGFPSSMPPLAAVTSDRLAVLRLHGRRRETWETPVSVVSERYRYLYDSAELGEWVPRLVDVAQRTQGVHVLMNNCHANYGTTNADEITALLVEFDRERRLLR